MQGFIPADNPRELTCSEVAVYESTELTIWMHSATPGLFSVPKLAEDFKRIGFAAFAEINAGAVLLVRDNKSGTSFLAIDRMGIESVCYARSNAGIVFGTRPGEVAEGQSSARKISRQSLFNYLFFHSVPSPSSAYDGVIKLLPGEVLVCDVNGGKPQRYWQPEFSGDLANTQEVRAELHNVLRGAVARTSEICPPDQVGAFLSGGLDSSTVVGFLADAISQPATFSIGFGVEGYDELEYARIANKHFGARGHEYIATARDVLDSFEEIAAAYDEPFGNSSVVPTLLCARLAKQHGIELLLAGDGGDELFAGNERYAKNKVFESYFKIPAVIRKVVFDPLAAALPGDSSLLPVRKFKSYVDQANEGLPRRFESWNYAYREGIATILEPEFAKSIDVESPFAMMESVFNATATGDIVDRMLAYDWKFTLADSDLRKVTRMCELAGVSVAFPMLDAKLVDFSTRMSGNTKLKGLNLRSFYKHSMQQFLPTQILNKEKHGFGMPFGIWLKEEPELADMIYKRLNALKNRGIVQPGFIDQLIKDQQAGHASYYGFFLWDLAMLEAWLDHKKVSV